MLLVVAQKSSRRMLLALLHLVALFVDHGHARLLAEGRIRQHHIVIDRRLGNQAILPRSYVLFAAEPVEQQVHGAEARRGRNQFDGVERFGLQVT